MSKPVYHRIVVVSRSAREAVAALTRAGRTVQTSCTQSANLHPLSRAPAARTSNSSQCSQLVLAASATLTMQRSQFYVTTRRFQRSYPILLFKSQLHTRVKLSQVGTDTYTTVLSDGLHYDEAHDWQGLSYHNYYTIKLCTAWTVLFTGDWLHLLELLIP